MIESQDLSRPALRRKLRQARRALSPLQQRLAARALYRQLAQHPLFRRARHIALYLPNDGE
ncbi:TPA: 5-formyltetrahydrofolate cyclo-ligase, partial [Pseudomonas aeruginosa]|nr:5-formyltetrahydrofolate cyclo-ligase [Pseudomonas aeruginosa]HBO7247991.1 5-formyltetrahydrofolate cyclo-ligase [Pseudomonas aeruginosa]